MLRRLWLLALRLTPRDLRDRFADEVLTTADAIDRARPRRPRQLLRAAFDALIWPWAVRRERRRHQRAGPAGRRFFEPVRADLRFALRGLRRDPVFTAFVATALALGIGANTALLGVADRMLLSGPAHIDRVGEVVQFHAVRETTAGGRLHNPTFGHVTYDLFRTRARSLAAVATYTVNDAVLDRREAARPIRLGFASAGLFPLLGVDPAEGRFFSGQEDDPTGAEAVVILSAEARRAWFGSRTEVLGRTIVLNDEPHVVIGVAPEGFTGPQFGRVDAWIPMNRLSPRVTSDFRSAWTAQWLQIVARLEPGATIEAASVEATTLFREAWAAPRPLPSSAFIRAVGLRASDLETGSADVRLLGGLMGVALTILLVACANIANLMLARAVRRNRELAVRAALGAGRWRLARLVLLEAACLSAGGVLVGVPVAELVGTGLRRAVFTDISWSGTVVDARLGIAAMAVAAAVALLVGLVPAIRASRASSGDALKSGSVSSTASRSRIRTALTVVQVTLSAMLLVGAGLLARSLWNIHQLDLGIDADRVLVVEVNWPRLGTMATDAAREIERARRRTFYLDEAAVVAGLPGVEAAAVAIGMPFGYRFGVPLRVGGVDQLPQLGSEFPGVSAVGPGYFETAGTTIVRGRPFDARDRAGSAPVAIVNETMADAVWPGGSPVGACLFIGPDATTCAEVVGVAEDTHQAQLREPASMHYYVPAGQEAGFGGSVLLVRPSGDGVAVLDAVRRQLAGDDPAITSLRVETLQERIDPQIQPWRRATVVFGGAGLLALLVAGVGLYSVVSYLVADRRREIGVRLALGARPVDVARLVLRHSLLTAAAGVGLGCLAGAILGRVAEPLLFDTSALDPLVYLAVAASLLCGACLSAIGPVRRAREVNPTAVLRGD